MHRVFSLSYRLLLYRNSHRVFRGKFRLQGATCSSSSSSQSRKLDKHPPPPTRYGISCFRWVQIGHTLFLAASASVLETSEAKESSCLSPPASTSQVFTRHHVLESARLVLGNASLVLENEPRVPKAQPTASVGNTHITHPVLKEPQTLVESIIVMRREPLMSLTPPELRTDD